MKIAIVGTGYIGLVSGVCLAKIGHSVTCVDHDEKKIQALRDGVVPIFEPGLSEMIGEVTGSGLLHFSTDVQEATASCEALFIAVGTPTGPDGESSDLSYVYAAARQIAAGLKGFTAIIVKSTVPVGTGREVERIMREAAPGADFEVVSNPEFLREGAAVFDFMNPDRIVIGSRTARGREVLDLIYAPFIERNTPMVYTDPESAELIKFASNGFLATKIAFVNEIANLCEKTGADVRDVAKGMGLDERIGAKFLQAGPGYGGSCFPKDTRALAAIARQAMAPLPITEAVITSNERTKQRMSERILALAGGNIGGKTIAVFGVTFKPDTDDMRDAPSLTILPPLMQQGAKLRIVDPEGYRHGHTAFPHATWLEDPYAAAEGADMVVVLTEWRMFRMLDLARLARGMNTAVLADLRNIYAPEALTQAGFSAFCHVGRS